VITWRHYLPENADGLDIAVTIERYIKDERKWKDALEWVKQNRPDLHEIAADYLRAMYQRRQVARKARALSGREVA
jgi:hypothetical protein